ncbi:multicopper oxidase [Beauveria brongniartii RCEF 3172]|uniref:Multicopper oxidase n=1 Tax=Beauveria brongniartii RCEF 3172 TaxID=1081107 RepID=A0A167DTU5_9HYPO|nr:multicopper oxidase [Beauveria brongniartii RCEF 3172]
MVLLQRLSFGLLVHSQLWCLEAQAAVVLHDFNIGWVTVNPDGAFDRTAIGINGKWPIPRIDANVGDTVIIHVHNQLGNQSTSLHFHGLVMNGTAHMDGPSQVTQCPIPPGGSFTYHFTIDQPGTYWYHSHTHSQYPDGLRGPLIIHDPESPYSGKYDEEIVLTLSDWYHDQMAHLIPQFMSKGNPTGAEPVPQAALMNDTQNLHVFVKPKTTYLLRLINIGAFAGQYFWIQGHAMTVVEVDGIYTKPYETHMIYLSAAQRYSVLLTTKDNADSNFAIVGSMDTSLFDLLPTDLDCNVTSWLVYDGSKDLPKPVPVSEFEPIDDVKLFPHDGMQLLPEPQRTVKLEVKMDNLGDGSNYALFNNNTYREPKVPSLYTALTAGELATNPKVYGDYTNSFVLEKDEIVQIVINNLDDGRHPFHLHGHQFQVIHRSGEDGGEFIESAQMQPAFPSTPMRRDTVVVEGNGNAVLRFKADNPGVWLFHCHIEWHIVSGLLATFVEAPLELQKTISLPASHLDNCKAAGLPFDGNAAGNTDDFLDLTGQNAPPGPLPDGFTAKGIVAFVISCIVGVTGLLFVAWFGLSPRELSESARDELLADGEDDEAVAVQGASVRESEDDEEQRRSTDYLLGGSSGRGRA